MSALDNIIEAILQQANAEAEGILEEARKKAAEILAKGQADREEYARQHEEAADRECREILARAESADRLNRRRALLETRNQVVDEVVAEAKAKIKDSADEQKFAIVQQGNIVLNNSIDAIFEAERQTLRDIAYEALL